MSTLTFTGRTQASKRRNAFDIAYENGFVNSEEDYAASLDGIDMKLSSDNYIRNLRLTGNNIITVEMVLSGLNEEGTLTVTCSDSITRNLIVAINGTSITPTDEVEGLQKGYNVTVQIPYNARYDVTLTMVSSDTDVKTITAVDNTKYDHDFGACSEVPIKYVEAGVDHFVINGDYFVASVDFSTYVKGVPYKFNGTSWVEMQASHENADRMLHALGSVLNDSTVTVPSTSAIYGWFQNLVAQNGVFESLAANVAFLMALITKNITVGTYGTGFCFRALSDDGNGDKIFDVTYYGNSLFNVDINTGKIYFGNNFYYDPSYGNNGAIRSTNDNVVINESGVIYAKGAQISGNSVFHGRFDCDVIKSVVNTGSSTDFATRANNYSQARLLWQDLNSAGYVPSSGISGFLSAEIVGVTSPIRYITTEVVNSPGYLLYYISFYNSNFSMINIDDYISCTANPPTSGVHSLTSLTNDNGGRYATNGFTLRVYTGGNMLQVDIPASAAGLSHGQLYYDPQTGSVMMKI